MRTTLVLALLSLAGCVEAKTPGLADAPGLPDARPLVDAPFLGCAPTTGAGTMHQSITTAETWTAADSPHILPFDTEISAAVTVEPCAIVQIAGGATVTVSPGGALVATGTSTRVVTFERLDPNTAWATIRSLGGDLSFSHAVIQGGGAPLSTNPAYAGAVRLQGSGTMGSLHVDDVDVADSASQGIYIDTALIGFDATSQNLRIHGSATRPLHVYPNVLGTIPTGTYTGNGTDEIAIAGSGGAVTTSQTLHDRGVPYHVGSGVDGVRMDVNAQVGVATLTIEPGVTMRFGAGGTLNIDPATGTDAAHGALIAIGTPTQKIVFTSDAATPAAGDWLGIGFGRAASAADAMQYAQVAYAGGDTVTGSNSCPYPGRTGPNYAAIRIFGTTAPGGQFITQTEIIASLRDGIDRGWRDDPAPDFLATNSFDVAGCEQSVPRTFNGVCPPTPACP